MSNSSPQSQSSSSNTSPSPRYLTRRFAKTISGQQISSLNENQLFLKNSQFLSPPPKRRKSTSQYSSQSPRSPSSSSSRRYLYFNSSPYEPIQSYKLKQAVASSSLDTVIPTSRIPFLYEAVITTLGGEKHLSPLSLEFIQQFILDVVSNYQLFQFLSEPILPPEIEYERHKNLITLSANENISTQLFKKLKEKNSPLKEKIILQLIVFALVQKPTLFKNSTLPKHLTPWLNSCHVKNLEKILSVIPHEDSSEDNDEDSDNEIHSNLSVKDSRLLKNPIIQLESSRLKKNSNDSESIEPIYNFNSASFINHQIHSYHKLMDSNKVTNLRKAYSNPVSWTKEQWDLFQVALSKFAYSPIANKKIAQFMGPNVHPNHVVAKKRQYKRNNTNSKSNSK